MLLTKQQKYLLAVLDKLGCAEQRQLAALLQKMFAFSSHEDAVRVTNACVRQMQMGGLLQISEDGIVHTCDYVNTEIINAIAVMLELSSVQSPEEFRAVDRRILLRFSLGEPSFKQFAIVSGSASPPERELRQEETVIVLLPNGAKPELSYARPIIFAIRQEDGTHRFFARK